MKKTSSLMALAAILTLAVVALTSAGKKPIHLFLVGDSTMADKTELEISPERGWGQLFPTYLTENVIVENHAMNGRSTKSFQTEGRWDSVLVRIQRGDVVILQFGHNDQKVSDPTRYSSIEQYQENLMKMAKEARKKGAKVVLATPINRRSFSAESGKFVSKHGAYPDAVRRVAKHEKLPLLDMEKATADWLTELGDEGSVPYFMNVQPGECTKFPAGKIDNTHLRENGALAVGKMAAEQLKKLKIKGLSSEILLDNVTPKYTVFCRPDMKSDKKTVESDLKTDLK